MARSSIGVDSDGGNAVMMATETLSPEKRAQILQGAAAVFAQDGYEGASMSRIASEAAVSKGTLYNYFEGKADLFAAYVQQECTRNLSRVFDRIDEADDPATTLRAIGRRIVRMMVSPTGVTIYRVVVSEAERFPELARVFYEAGPARAIGHMSRWLALQARRGRLNVADPEFAAEQFFALCQTRLGLRCRLHMLNDPAPETIAAIVNAAVDMFLCAYAMEQRESA